MSRTIYVSGAEHNVRLGSFSFVEAARNGEVGQGGMNLLDEGAAYDINSHRPVLVTDSAATGTVFSGYVGDKDLARFDIASVDSNREFALDLVDLNTILGDRIIRDVTGNRPAETDHARVTWLASTAYIGGLTLDMTSTGAVNMPARDYRGGTGRDVLSECAEMAGILFFAYWDNTDETAKLFYWQADDSAHWVSAATLSSDYADVFLAGPFGSDAVRKPGLHRGLSGGRVYSGVEMRYGSGASVYVSDAAIATAFRTREVSIFDASVKTSAAATVKANQFLAASATEEEVIECEVDLAAANVNDIRAGHIISVKFPHLGIPDYVWRRVVRREVRPRGDGEVDSVDYRLRLELSMPKSTRWTNRGAPGNPTEDATVAIDTTGIGAPTRYQVQRQLSAAGVYSESFGTPAGAFIESRVYDNTAYASCGCPVGGGGWSGYLDKDIFYQFTAPADPSDIGMAFTLNAAGMTSTGYVAGYDIRLYPGAAAAGLFGLGSPFMQGPVSGTSTIYIPTSLITWGAANCIVLHPSWLCARNAFFCNPAANFDEPGLNDGRGMSGRYAEPSVSGLGVASLTTPGWAPWVSGIGAVNGTNATFTLKNWSGTGPVQATVNGLEWGSTGWLVDGTLKQITLDTPPPANSVVFWRYIVTL